MRHCEFKFGVKRIVEDTSEICVYISDKDSGWEDDLFDWTSEDQYVGPIELIKRIQEGQNWTIENVGELQYSFVEDENHIIFQMDDLFGFVVLIKNKDQLNSAMKLLHRYID